MNIVSNPQVGVGVACFVWKDGKFLIQQRYGSHGEGTWSVPGGHLEFGESWKACAAREVMEETGLTITNIQFLTATNDLFTEKGKHYISIWMAADWKSGEPRIMEPDRAKNQEWRNFHNLPSPLFEPCWQNLRAVRPDLFQ